VFFICDAVEHLGVVQWREAPIRNFGERVCASGYGHGAGAGGDVHGLDCAGERVLGPAGIFARAYSAGWREFFVVFAKVHPTKQFPAVSCWCFFWGGLGVFGGSSLWGGGGFFFFFFYVGGGVGGVFFCFLWGFFFLWGGGSFLFFFYCFGGVFFFFWGGGRGALALILSVTLDLQNSIAGILAVDWMCNLLGGRGIDDAAAALGQEQFPFKM